MTANMPALRAIYKAHTVGSSEGASSEGKSHEMGNMSKISKNTKLREMEKESNASQEELFVVGEGGGIKVKTNVEVESRFVGKSEGAQGEYFKFPEHRRKDSESPV